MALGPTVRLVFDADTSRLEKGVSRASLSMGILSAGIASSGALVAGALAAPVLGFAAIGIAAAVQSEKVKTAWTGVKDHVVNKTKEMAAPIETVLVGLAGKAKAAFDSVTPQLSEMFRVTAPYIDQLASGVISFAQNAMPGLVTATNAAQPVVTALRDGIASFGTTIGTFFTNLSTGSAGAGAGFTALMGVIGVLLPALGTFLASLANISGVMINNLRPVIDGIAAGLTNMATWINNNQVAAANIATAIGAFALAMVALNVGLKAYNAIAAVVTVATKAWAASQLIFNAIMAANPISIVIIAIAALVAGIIIAYQTSETFRNIVDTVWRAVQSAITTAVNTIKGVLNWFAGLGGMFRNWWEAAKAAVIQKANEIVNWVKGIPNMITTALGNLGNLLINSGKALVDGFLTGLKNAWGAVTGWIGGAIQAVRDFFPGSPAKTGPLSGSGYVTHSGAAMMNDFAGAIRSNIPAVAGAAYSATSAVATEFGNRVRFEDGSFVPQSFYNVRMVKDRAATLDLANTASKTGKALRFEDGTFVPQSFYNKRIVRDTKSVQELGQTVASISQRLRFEDGTFVPQSFYNKRVTSDISTVKQLGTTASEMNKRITFEDGSFTTQSNYNKRVMSDIQATNDLTAAAYRAAAALGAAASATRVFEDGSFRVQTEDGSYVNPSFYGRPYDNRRAMGGSVHRGSTYLVGERGPELLTMRSSGVVTPNMDSISSYSMNRNNQVANTTSPPPSIDVIVMIDGKEFHGMIKTEISEANRSTRAAVMAGRGAR